ncbi:MAG TPA: TolC family protein [Pirellulales bacterium]|nr:TolC family protein [Pirellulales bacterium]
MRSWLGKLICHRAWRAIAAGLLLASVIASSSRSEPASPTRPAGPALVQPTFQPGGAVRESLQPEPILAGEATTETADYGNRTLSASAQLPLLVAAPLEAADLALPINLAAALRLSDGRPLMVTAAQASAWVAEARYQRANLIKVPEFDFGVCYIRHDGFGPDFNHGVNEPTFVPGVGGPLNQNLNWMYIGGSFYGVIPLTEAIFEPLAARQVLDARRFDVQAAKNNALFVTAHQYFMVHQYRGQYAGAVDVVARGEKLVERIRGLSTDLVPKVEVNRASNALAAMQQRAAFARQQWRVASANLTQVLRLDPRIIVVPLEADHLQITLVDPSRSLDELMPIAMNNRPELASRRSMVQAATAEVRLEKARPMLPTIYLTGFQSPGRMRMQGMVFGLGNDDKMNNWSLREDVSLQLIWQLEGFGLGNLGRIKQRRGMESSAIVDLRKEQDGVVAEVTRAQADLHSAAVRVIQAERSLQTALITYDGNYEGLTQTQRFENVLVQIYRPQEAVMALESLMTAYDQYFATVADYNRAQFALFHALGYPARELSALRPPGEAELVNTDRPGYLPRVGVGPPPATR